MTDRVCVGAIAGSFGVKGEVRLKSFCGEADAIASYGPLSDEPASKTYDIRLTRQVKGGFAARLSGVDTKEAADALKGTRLYADRDRLPELPDDEFYHTDLIGLIAFDTGGAEVGRVKAVLNHGAGDLLEITVKGQQDPVLLPFTLTTVPTVDINASRIIIDPPEGFFD
ncbi:ribosome maturation factor RimM [Rhodobacteraceae bacterium]|nr:ribosome maturation factor RimM [Paracoccaceae bacterium]